MRPRRGFRPAGRSDRKSLNHANLDDDVVQALPGRRAPEAEKDVLMCAVY